MYKFILDNLPIFFLIIGILIGRFDYDDRLDRIESSSYARGVRDMSCIVGVFEYCDVPKDPIARDILEELKTKQ